MMGVRWRSEVDSLLVRSRGLLLSWVQVNELPNSCFTASSSKDIAKLAPWNAKINSHSGWRGEPDEKDPYLQVHATVCLLCRQIDMQKARLLLKVNRTCIETCKHWSLTTQIFIQGQGGSDCWVTALKLLISLDGVSWQTYGASADRSALVFPGNMDSESVVEHALPVPVVTRFVRFCPMACHTCTHADAVLNTEHAATAGLRVELCARDLGAPIGIAVCHDIYTTAPSTCL